MKIPDLSSLTEQEFANLRQLFGSWSTKRHGQKKKPGKKGRLQHAENEAKENLRRRQHSEKVFAGTSATPKPATSSPVSSIPDSTPQEITPKVPILVWRNSQGQEWAYVGTMSANQDLQWWYNNGYEYAGTREAANMDEARRMVATVNYGSPDPVESIAPAERKYLTLNGNGDLRYNGTGTLMLGRAKNGDIVVLDFDADSPERKVTYTYFIKETDWVQAAQIRFDGFKKYMTTTDVPERAVFLPGFDFSGGLDEFKLKGFLF